MNRTIRKPNKGEIEVLQKRYKAFIDRLRAAWILKNNRPPHAWVLYELDADEQKRVHAMQLRWEDYITPRAERWWKRSGIGIRWPEKSSDPCQFYWLADAA